MAWYDYATWNPFKYVYEGATGHGWGASNGNLYNGSASNALNTLEGNPAGVSSQISGLMDKAFQQGGYINNMLQGEKAQAENYYRPMQQMFGSMYGSGGLMPAKAPGTPGGGSAY